jgi:hypothetical protein
MTQTVSDLTETLTGGDVSESVHFKTHVLTAPRGSYVSVSLQRTLDQTADPDPLNPFAGPPGADARITRVGNQLLGQQIGDTPWRDFDTCPTWWQGFPDGAHEIEVTMRTRYAVATTIIHLHLVSLFQQTTTADRPPQHVFTP